MRLRSLFVFLLLVSRHFAPSQQPRNALIATVRLHPTCLRLEAEQASQMEVTCVTCHGDQHTTADDVAKVKLPTPDTCATCHQTQVDQYKKENTPSHGQRCWLCRPSTGSQWP